MGRHSGARGSDNRRVCLFVASAGIAGMRLSKSLMQTGVQDGVYPPWDGRTLAVLAVVGVLSLP